MARLSSSYSSPLLEARSLAMHVLVAAKIERNRRLLEIPRRTLQRWTKSWKEEVPTWRQEWSEIMNRPWSEIAAFITDPGEEAARLRRFSPFASVLSAAERRRVDKAFGAKNLSAS